MQKKIIALAIAGLASSAAFAQSNVTLYGLIDQTFLYSNSSAPAGVPGDYNFTGIKDGGLNGSRLGAKGEEALGNGLKAIFVWEMGRDADNQGGITNRQTFVGLSSNAGTFTVGRQYNASAAVYSKNTSNDVTGVMPVNSLQGQVGSQIRSGGGNARQDNVIKYASPNWSGFTVLGSYSFGESPETLKGKTYNDNADWASDGRWAIAADYSNGPFNVSASYAVTTDVRNTTGSLYTASNIAGLGGKDIKEWFVGAGFDFKVVKLYATYQDLKNDNNGVDVVTDTNLWSVGLSAPIAQKGKAYIEYARFDGETKNAAINSDGSSKGWGIGYEHYMSKRTTLYTQFSQIDHDSNVATVGSWQSGTALAGEKQTNFMAGIRHTF